jgi:hypothetical protein
VIYKHASPLYFVTILSLRKANERDPMSHTIPRPVSDSQQGDHLPLFLPSTQVSFWCSDFTFVRQRIITIARCLFYKFSLNTKLHVRVAVSLFEWEEKMHTKF